jgi:hypothetical protein
LGGTGGGLTCTIAYEIESMYGRSPTSVGVQLISDQHLFSSIVESYNWVLANNSLLEHIRMNVVHTNENLSELLYLTSGVESPSHRQLNALIVDSMANVTSGFRFISSSF